MLKFYIKSFFVAAIVAVMNAVSFAEVAQEIKVVPMPNKLTMSDGQFDTKREFRIFAPNGFAEVVEVVASQVDKMFPNFAVKATSSDLANIKIEKVASIPEEGYELKVSANGAQIRASTATGALYAFQTLMQAMDKLGKVACCDVVDAPRFKFRGMMIDPARNFFGKRFILDTIDRLLEVKMNVLHLHLTDFQGWRLEIKKYPKLTEVGAWYHHTSRGGYLTQDDAREIVEYARKRGVTVIPEIEALSHATAAVKAYPFLGDGRGINVYDPKVREFFKDVLREVMDIFPSKIIHLAGDEVVYKVWEENPKIKEYMRERGLKTMLDLHLAYMNDMGEFLQANGRRMMAWDEAFGKGEIEVAKGLSASVSKASKDTIMHFWTGNVPAMIEAANDGYQIVNANRRFTYFNHAARPDSKYRVVPLPEDSQFDDTGIGYFKYATSIVIPLSKIYNFDPIPAEIEEKSRKNILGASCQLWEKPIYDVAFWEFMTFPRAAALAEATWTNPENKNYNSFTNRLKSLQYIWDYIGVNQDYDCVETTQFYYGGKNKKKK